MFILRLLIPTTEAITYCVVYSVLPESWGFPVGLAEMGTILDCVLSVRHYYLECDLVVLSPNSGGFFMCMSSSAFGWTLEETLLMNPKFSPYSALSFSTLTCKRTSFVTFGSAWAPLPPLLGNSQGSKLGCRRALLACFASLRDHRPLLWEFNVFSRLCVLAALTIYYQLDCLKHRHLFPHISGSWKSEVRVSAWLESNERSLPGLQMATFLLCLCMAFSEYKWRESSLPLVRPLFLLDYNPTFMASFNFNYLLNALSPNTVMWGLRSQHRNLVGWTQFSHSIRYLANHYFIHFVQFTVVSGGSVNLVSVMPSFLKLKIL